MNTQIVAKIETIEKELYDLKTLLQTETMKNLTKKVIYQDCGKV